jgi:outer membrane immunogenic protein
MIRSRMLLSAALVAISAASASAADLPMRPADQQLISPVPVYNWTGLYVGLNAGYGWGTQNPLSLLSSNFDKFTYNVNGGMAGGTFGGQIQAGHVVMGLEGDADWADVRGSSTVTPTILGAPAGFTLGVKSNASSYFSGRARVGYAMDNWLLYGTGGAAILNSDVTGNVLSGAACGTAGVLPRCSGSSNRIGVAAGLGVEYGFTPNWSAKAEYIWSGFAVGAGTENLNMLRLGVNYRFGG